MIACVTVCLVRVDDACASWNDQAGSNQAPESYEGLHFLRERQRPGTPDRERAFDCGLRVVLRVVIELKADQGLSALACSTSF